MDLQRNHCRKCIVTLLNSAGLCLYYSFYYRPHSSIEAEFGSLRHDDIKTQTTSPFSSPSNEFSYPFSIPRWALLIVNLDHLLEMASRKADEPSTCANILMEHQKAVQHLAQCRHDLSEARNQSEAGPFTVMGTITATVTEKSTETVTSSSNPGNSACGDAKDEIRDLKNKVDHLKEREDDLHRQITKLEDDARTDKQTQSLSEQIQKLQDEKVEKLSKACKVDQSIKIENENKNDNDNRHLTARDG